MLPALAVHGATVLSTQLAALFFSVNSLVPQWRRHQVRGFSLSNPAMHYGEDSFADSFAEEFVDAATSRKSLKALSLSASSVASRSS